MSEQEARNKALDKAITDIEKEFGKGSIMKMGDEEIQPMEIIPTGAIGLDIALGVGGIPRGRVIEVYGPESSGKTTLALHMVAEAQMQGGNAAFIDAEHALDPEYSQNLGVDVENLLLAQPDTGEEALEIAERLVRSNAVDIVVIDSVAALVPRAEIEGAMGDSFIGLQARLMSQALRKITGAIAKSQTTVVFINQLREKVGVMFGNPETTTGGRALKFYSSVRLDIRRIDSIKRGDEFLGSRVRVRVVKNKVSPPFKTAEFDIMYGEGISKLGNILDAAADSDIVNKAGAWYSYGEERLGQGRQNATDFLEEHPEMAKEIEAKVRLENGLNMPSGLEEIAERLLAEQEVDTEDTETEEIEETEE